MITNTFRGRSAGILRELSQSASSEISLRQLGSTPPRLALNRSRFSQAGRSHVAFAKQPVGALQAPFSALIAPVRAKYRYCRTLPNITECRLSNATTKLQNTCNNFYPPNISRKSHINVRNVEKASHIFPPQQFAPAEITELYRTLPNFIPTTFIRTQKTP
jgi:hypothetical protein